MSPHQARVHIRCIQRHRVSVNRANPVTGVSSVSAEQANVLAALNFPSRGPIPFRFVRHLPVRRYDAAHGTGLRAGVGQALGEATAGRGAVPRGSYSAMAMVGGAPVLVVVMRSSRWSAQPGQSQTAGPTRCFAAGLLRLAGGGPANGRLA